MLMETSRLKKVIFCQNDVCRSYDQGLIIEEPLAIRVEGEPYSVVMRTPGDEINHAAGFCLAEGLIDHPDDIDTIGLCDEGEANVVTVTLKPERRDRVKALLDRRGFVSQTSCGICGKELIDDMQQILKTVKDEKRISVRQAIGCVDKLIGRQELYKTTRGAHSAMIFDYSLEPMAQAEDVGRQLRRANLKARTFTLKLKHDDFKQVTRSKTLKQPTNSTEIIYLETSRLLMQYRLTRSIRLIGVGVSNLIQLKILR